MIILYYHSSGEYSEVLRGFQDRTLKQFQGFKRKSKSADIQNDEGNKRPRSGRLDSGLGDVGLRGEDEAGETD